MTQFKKEHLINKSFLSISSRVSVFELVLLAAAAVVVVVVLD